VGKQPRRVVVGLCRSFSFAAVILSIFLSSTTSVSQSKLSLTPSVAEEQDYVFASGLFRDRLYQLAQQQLQSFSEKYPNSLKRAEAQFLSNECLFFTDQFSKALAGYTEYLRDYPRSSYAADAWFRTGEIHLKSKQPAAAITSFKKVMDEFSEGERVGEAAYWVGESYLRIQDFENATKYYTLAYEGYPQSSVRDFALYSMAWANQKKSAFAVAIQMYKKFLGEFPNSTLASSAHVRIGECAFYAKDYRHAIEELTHSRLLIHDSTEGGEADYLIADAFYQLADYPTAEIHFTTFVASHPDHRLTREASYSLGWTLLKQGKLDSARAIFGEIAGGTDDLAYASLFRRGVLEKLLGAKEKASQTFLEVFARDSAGESSDNALYEQAQILYEQQNYAQALRLFDQVVESFPQSDVAGEALRMAGECLVVSQQYAPAKVRFSRALGAKDIPFDTKVAATFQQAWCSFKQKDYSGAVQQFDDFIRQFAAHPKTAEAHFFIGESEYARGRFGEAIKSYQQVATTSDKKPDALYGIGWSNFKNNEFEAAIDAFEQFIATHPKHPLSFDARLRLGDCYYNLKDFTKAAASFRTTLRMFPDTAATDYACYQAGQSLFRAGDVSGAFLQFEELPKKFPHSALADDAQYALGWINFQRKDYNEAIKEFQTTARNFPNSDNAPRALYSLGDCYYNLKQLVAAEKSYREVLNRFPESKYVADAVTGIQYCLVAQGNQAQALKVIDDFLKEHPTSGASEDLTVRKIELYFNQRDYAAAADACRMFERQFPGSKQLALATMWLARCYQAEENTTEAAQTFSRAAANAGASELLRANAYLEAVSAYEKLQVADKVIELLEEGERKLHDENLVARLHLRHGEYFFRRTKIGEALGQFSSVIALAKLSEEADRARISSAAIKIQFQDYGAARSLAGRVATSRTDALGAEAQVVLGRCLLAEKDFAQAVTAFLRVQYVFRAYESWVGESYLGLGEVYESQGDRGKAREVYRAATKLKNQKAIVQVAERRLALLERK